MAPALKPENFDDVVGVLVVTRLAGLFAEKTCCGYVFSVEYGQDDLNDVEALLLPLRGGDDEAYRALLRNMNEESQRHIVIHREETRGSSGVSEAAAIIRSRRAAHHRRSPCTEHPLTLSAAETLEEGFRPPFFAQNEYTIRSIIVHAMKEAVR